MRYIVANDEFFPISEDEQAVLVQLPDDFTFARATEHDEGVISGEGGQLLYSAADSGTILRVVIKRKAAANSSV